MVKICHVTSVHESRDVRIFHKECTSLAKAGYDTYLVARGESREENGVHVIGLGEAPAGRLKRMTAFVDKVYKKALEIDAEIYHLHDPELLPCGVRLKKHGKKVIFDSHEKYVEQIRNKAYLPKWLCCGISLVYEKYENLALGKLDAVIFPCTYQGRHPFEGKCSRTVTVDNYPRLEELYEKYDELAEKTDNSICYVGGLTHNRGITALVDAMAQIDGCLFLAGSFSSQAYEDRLKGLPGWNRVEYLGRLDRNQICALLQKSRVGAATILNVGQYNRYDNLATKAYEYMSLGLPVLLTKAPYNEQVNEKYHIGLCVDPEDTVALTGAAKYLFSHPEAAKQMGRNGRRAVREEFNWGTQEKKLLALYQNLCTD